MECSRHLWTTEHILSLGGKSAFSEVRESMTEDMGFCGNQYHELVISSQEDIQSLFEGGLSLSEKNHLL